MHRRIEVRLCRFKLCFGGVAVSLSGRDYKVLECLSKWRFLLGKHIEFLCDFPSSRTMYRRLKTLIDNKLIEKQKIIYGIPSIYTLEHKGLILLGLNKRKDKIRIDNIKHNIHVIDTLIYLVKTKVIDNIDQVTSEKELNQKNGFSNRKHQPDFIFENRNKSYAIEIELSIKSIERLEKNIKDNFLNYDNQIWVIEKKNKKIERNITSISSKYTSVEILYLEELMNE